MNNHTSPQDAHKRACLTVFGLGGLLALLGCQPRKAHGGLSPQSSGLPTPPYGQDINVLQTPSHMEFEFQIVKEARYDIVLEVYKKAHYENVPEDVIQITSAHFHIRLDQLTPPGEPEQPLVDQVVHGKLDMGSYGMSTNDRLLNSKKPWYRDLLEQLGLIEIDNFSDLKYPMSRKYILTATRLKPGRYRLRADALQAMPQMEGRFIQVTIRASRTKH